MKKYINREILEKINKQLVPVNHKKIAITPFNKESKSMEWKTCESKYVVYNNRPKYSDKIMNKTSTQTPKAN